jgi:hypothetical protein
MESIEPPWQAIKEWIASTPFWPCGMQEPPPDLVFIIRRLNAAGAFPTNNPTSTGSTVTEIHPIPIQTVSTRDSDGNLRKSNWTTQPRRDSGFKKGGATPQIPTEARDNHTLILESA